MDDFLTKYLNGPIKEVVFESPDDRSWRPKDVIFILVAKNVWNQTKNQPEDSRTRNRPWLSGQFVWSIDYRKNIDGQNVLKQVRKTMVIGVNWDDLYFDYLEYVADKPVVYGKTIY